MHAHQYIGVPECHDLAAVHKRHRWGRGVVVIVTACPRHNTMHLYAALHTTIPFQWNVSRDFSSRALALTSFANFRNTRRWHKFVAFDIEHPHEYAIYQSSEPRASLIKSAGKIAMWKLIKYPEMCSSDGRAARARVWRTMTALCRVASAQRKCSRADSAPSAKMTFFFTARKLVIFPDDPFGTMLLWFLRIIASPLRRYLGNVLSFRSYFNGSVWFRLCVTFKTHKITVVLHNIFIFSLWLLYHPSKHTNRWWFRKHLLIIGHYLAVSSGRLDPATSICKVNYNRALVNDRVTRNFFRTANAR